MTDKEQINNFDKDINVPRKEPIMVDGVDVGGCKYLNTFSDSDGYHYYCDLADDIKNEYCEHYRDCYFKQLARKTQECEELKRKVELMMDCPDCKVDEYKKALEEIKEYTREQFCDNCEDIGSTEYTCHCEYCEYQEYFDIINKAKGENKNE